MDITQIILAIIALLGTIITAVVVPLIKQKTTDKQQQNIAQWVKIAVIAAEQIIKGPDQGEKRYDYVIEWLKKHNIALDNAEVMAQVELLIEAFVAELNGKGRIA